MVSPLETSTCSVTMSKNQGFPANWQVMGSSSFLASFTDSGAFPHSYCPSFLKPFSSFQGCSSFLSPWGYSSSPPCSTCQASLTSEVSPNSVVATMSVMSEYAFGFVSLGVLAPSSTHLGRSLPCWSLVEWLRVSYLPSSARIVNLIVWYHASFRTAVASSAGSTSSCSPCCSVILLASSLSCLCFVWHLLALASKELALGLVAQVLAVFWLLQSLVHQS